MRNEYFKFLLVALFLRCSLWAAPHVHAQSAAVSQAVWQPVTRQNLKQDIRRYRNNGVAMDMLMDRALMYGQGRPFLDEVRAAMGTEPKNATLPASYARALIVLRGTYLWNGKEAPINLGPSHDLSVNNIASLIQSSKENSKRPWLALVAEEELAVYRGVGSVSTIYSARLQQAKKTVAIERNALTLTKLAMKLVTAEAYEKGHKGASQQAVDLLIRINRNYPSYWRARIFLWQAYAYYPVVRNKVKADKAYQDILKIIPDNLKRTKPIQRYLQWQHFDKRD